VDWSAAVRTSFSVLSSVEGGCCVPMLRHMAPLFTIA
jgi:hypothetical protein